MHTEGLALIDAWITSGYGFGFPDTDMDGLANNVDPDNDGDGIQNDWETANGLDPLDPLDANIDSDEDGFSNLVEFQRGTDPNDPNSFPPSLDVPSTRLPFVIVALVGASIYFVSRRRTEVRGQ